jgi:hypothetical protein
MILKIFGRKGYKTRIKKGHSILLKSQGITRDLKKILTVDHPKNQELNWIQENPPYGKDYWTISLVLVKPLQKCHLQELQSMLGKDGKLFQTGLSDIGMHRLVIYWTNPSMENTLQTVLGTLLKTHGML